MVNKVQGKGFEDSKNYTNIQFHFFDIENIHVVRSSLNRLLEGFLKMKLHNLIKILKHANDHNQLLNI
jgi:hypothetical protein